MTTVSEHFSYLDVKKLEEAYNSIGTKPFNLFMQQDMAKLSSADALVVNALHSARERLAR